jgi:hypothetical protein
MFAREASSNIFAASAGTLSKDTLMARARNIKPSFFTNDMLAEVSVLGRLLFIGLWTIADREGRLEDRPKKIKAEVLPYDDCDTDSLLNELAKNGFIVRYESSESKYIQILTFKKHQNPHIKEAESTIPAPYKHSANTVQVTTQTGTSHADSLLPITDSLLLKQTQEQKTVARLCQIFKDNNIQGFSSINPLFQELINQGVTADEFEDAAKNHQGRKFNYIVGVVKNIRSDAANMKLPPKVDKYQWLKEVE